MRLFNRMKEDSIIQNASSGQAMKHARRIVAARLPNHEPDAATTNEIENVEWLDDSAVVDEAVVEDNISEIR